MALCRPDPLFLSIILCAETVSQFARREAAMHKVTHSSRFSPLRFLPCLSLPTSRWRHFLSSRGRGSSLMVPNACCYRALWVRQYADEWHCSSGGHLRQEVFELAKQIGGVFEKDLDLDVNLQARSLVKHGGIDGQRKRNIPPASSFVL